MLERENDSNNSQMAEGMSDDLPESPLQGFAEDKELCHKMQDRKMKTMEEIINDLIIRVNKMETKINDLESDNKSLKS